MVHVKSMKTFGDNSGGILWASHHDVYVVFSLVRDARLLITAKNVDFHVFTSISSILAKTSSNAVFGLGRELLPEPLFESLGGERIFPHWLHFLK